MYKLPQKLEIIVARTAEETDRALDLLLPGETGTDCICTPSITAAALPTTYSASNHLQMPLHRRWLALMPSGLRMRSLRAGRPRS